MLPDRVRTSVGNMNFFGFNHDLQLFRNRSICITQKRFKYYGKLHDRRKPRYNLLNTNVGHKGHGWPLMWVVTADRPSWQPHLEEEYEVVARDEYGVPMQLGDDTPGLNPYVEKLIQGNFTREDYEEMFYKFAKPLRIDRKQIIAPYRSVEEMTKSSEVMWEGAWYSYRQRVFGEFLAYHVVREWIICCLMGCFASYLWVQQTRQYRISAKLFYLEAPEHKINWVKPRGDL